MIGVYCLIDPNTLEIRYVGQSNDIRRRYLDHITHSHLRDSHSKRWIRKLLRIKCEPILHVICNFEIYDKKLLDECEKYWIFYFKALGCKLCNLTDGGSGLFNPPLEIRNAIVKSGIGRKHSEETKRKMSEKAKIRESQKTKEYKEFIGIKISENKKGHKLGPISEETRIKKRKSIKIKPVTDDLGNVYFSISEASRITGINKSDIGSCANGKLMHAGGRKFSFVSNNNINYLSQNLNFKD